MAIRPFIGLLLVCVYISSHSAESARILISVATPGIISHYGYLHAMAPTLITNGNEVYSIIHRYSGLENRARQVGIIPLLYGNKEDFQKHVKTLEEEKYAMMTGRTDVMNSFKKVSSELIWACEAIMEDKSLIDEIKSKQFDLVMYDNFVLAPCSTIVAGALDIPHIGIGSAFNWWVSRVPALASFLPSYMDPHATDNMSFVKRLQSLLQLIVFSFEHPWVTPLATIANTSLIERYVKDPAIKTWGDLGRKSKLLVITRDELLEWPFPLMPHTITAACLTCIPAKKLPDDMEQLISANKHGVIIVSFGSGITHLPDDMFIEFWNAFIKVKQLVFWRYTGKNVPAEVPPHIKLSKWLPQNDILGHLKTKLFITHCGNNGQYESLYHGVPMIGFPIFAEQHHNALRAEVKNFSITMNVKSFKSNELITAINTVIGSDANESVYTRNAKIAKDKLQSRPVTPQDKVAYWVDYVIKYGGQDLRSHALEMGILEFLMVDLIAFIICVFLTLVLVCLLCGKYCFRFWRPLNKAKKE